MVSTMEKPVVNTMENPNVAPDSRNEEQEQVRGLFYGIIHLLMLIASAPFLALRQVYWWLDTDAAVRANGVELEGTVLKADTETRTYTDSETGEKTTVTEHFVTYRYETPEGSHTARKKVEDLGELKTESKIVVYYREPIDRPVTEKDSALDWYPRIPL